jgi:hypothetical protein
MVDGNPASRAAIAAAGLRAVAAPKERCMDNTVDVVIPLDAEAARILDSSARREAVGRYLSSLLKSGHVRDVLAETIAEAKREARHAGLTDEEVDAELDAWRAGR